MSENLDSLKYLDGKRLATAYDINALEEELQREFYLDRIKELKEENELLLKKIELKDNQLDYLYRLFNTDVSFFDNTELQG